ncbi:MAG: phosphotransferase [Actinomycetota bacterium]|nr:phosphotransferase [Actinomycetota bacterium]
MQTFETLSFRGQLGRLRRLAEDALAEYPLQRARLVPLTHSENTTFRVDTPSGERYVLRIHRTTGSPFHPPRSMAEVRSETVWISALRRDTGLAVPEPVPTADGSLLTVTEAEGVPAPRVCVLFRWGPGRFLDAGLTTWHLERVGRFIARLHDQALDFAPPAGFERWRIGDLTTEVTAYVASAVGGQFGSKAVSIVEAVMDLVQHARQELGTGPDVFGLIHADLHQENYLFHRGRVRAIDFDDCGWGHFVYDLAVTLSELRGRRDYAALRGGLLRGYRAVRPLPPGHERYLEVFHGLRLLQLTLWFLEQRDHPAFSDWEAEARDGLVDLRKLASRLASSP